MTMVSCGKFQCHRSVLTKFAEVADNTYRDGEADLNNTEASFIADGGVSTDQRKMNAVRAYFEWMPLR
jgi:alkaline phosphatase D